MHDGKRDNIPHNGQSQRRMIFAGNRRCLSHLLAGGGVEMGTELDVEVAVHEHFVIGRGVVIGEGIDSFSLGVMVAGLKDKRLRIHVDILVAGAVTVNPHRIDIHILIQRPYLLIGIGKDQVDVVFIRIGERGWSYLRHRHLRQSDRCFRPALLRLAGEDEIGVFGARLAVEEVLLTGSVIGLIGALNGILSRCQDLQSDLRYGFVGLLLGEKHERHEILVIRIALRGELTLARVHLDMRIVQVELVLRVFLLHLTEGIEIDVMLLRIRPFLVLVVIETETVVTAGLIAEEAASVGVGLQHSVSAIGREGTLLAVGGECQAVLLRIATHIAVRDMEIVAVGTLLDDRDMIGGKVFGSDLTVVDGDGDEVIRRVSGVPYISLCSGFLVHDEVCARPTGRGFVVDTCIDCGSLCRPCAQQVDKEEKCLFHCTDWLFFRN